MSVRAGDNGARPSQGPGCDSVVVSAGVVHCSSVFIMGSVQRSLEGSLDPVIIVLPLKITRHFSLSKMTSHPAMQRILIPSRDAIFISGTMCPTNGCGRPGMTMSHVCVDVIRLPSGRLMLIGWRAAQMLLAGAPAMTKIEVAPVSAMAWVGAIMRALTWCWGTVVVQFDAATVISSSSDERSTAFKYS